MLRRCLSVTLSVVLIIMLALTSNLNAQAGDYPFATPSDASEEVKLSVIVDGSANLVSEIDERELVPLTPEQIEFIQNYQEPEPVAQSDEMPEFVPVENNERVAIVVPIAIAAIIVILFGAYCSAVSVTSSQAEATNSAAYAIQSTLQDLMGKGPDWNENFQVVFAGTVLASLITAAKVEKLFNKMEEAGAAGGVAISLDNDDKMSLMYALQSKGLITNLEPENVNVKALDGYSHYYIYTDSFSPSTCYVLYSPREIAFSSCDKNSYGKLRAELYSVNYAAVEPMQKTTAVVGTYALDNATGLYEFVSSGTPNSIVLISKMAWQCMPFNMHYTNYFSSAEYYNNFLLGSNLLNGVSQGKVMTVSSIMNLGDISVSGDITSYTSIDKNMYGRVSGLNKAAGAIIDVAIPENPDKPVDPDNPGGGTGGGTVDISGILAELGLIKGILSTLKDNIAAGTTATNSLLAEVREIKAAIKDLSAAGGSVEILTALSGLTTSVGGIEKILGDVFLAQQDISSVLGDVFLAQENMASSLGDVFLASQNISSVLGDVFLAEKQISSVLGDVFLAQKQISSVLGDVFLAQQDIRTALKDVVQGQKGVTDAITSTGTAVGEKVDAVPKAITDAGTAVGVKVDALPKAITDTMTGAVATDLAGSQTLEGWSVVGVFQNKFPFSIPWDIAGSIALLKAPPVKPIWEIPFIVETKDIKVNEKVVIDLSSDKWDLPIKVVRAFLLIIFIVCLAMVTRGLIKG